MRAGQLVVDISANVARIQQDMEKTTGIVTAASRQIEGAANTAKKALTGIAAGFTLGAFASMIKETIALEASTHDLAQAAGTTAEALSSLIDTAKQSGTDMTAVAAGMQKLSKSMAEATDGTSKAAKVFAALKIATTDATGALRPTQAVMQELGQKLSSMRDQTLAVAFAQETMGKAGANLLPFLYELAKAGELHAKFTNEQAAAADAFEDNLVKLKSAGDKWKISLANAMIPALVEFTDKLILAKQASGNLFASLATMATAKTGGDISARLQAIDKEIEDKSAAAKATDDRWYTPSFLNIGGAALKVQIGTLMQEREYLKSVLAMQIENRPQSEWAKFLNSTYGGTKVANPLGKEGPQEKPKDDFTPMAKAIEERIALLKAENAASTPLTETQKELIKLQLDLDKGYKVISKSQLEWVKARLGELDAEDQLLQLKKRRDEADKAEQQRLKERLNGQFQAIAATDQEIRSLELQGEEIGLTTQQLDALRLARIDDAIAIKQREAAQAEATSNDASYIETLRIQAEQLQRLRTVTSDNQFRTAVAEQARAQQEAQAESWRAIDQTAHATWVSIFDGGKNTAQRLKETFRNTLFEYLYQMTLRKWVIDISASTSGAAVATQAFGAANVAGGGMGMLGSLGNAGGLGNTLSGLLGSGGTMLSGANALPGIVGTGAAEAAAGLGAAQVAGASGIGAALAAVPGWGWAALAGTALLGSSIFGGGGGPKGSDLSLQRQPDSGVFYVSANNVAGGDPDMSQIVAMNATLANAKSYDPSKLAGLVGTTVGTGGPADTSTLLSLLGQALQSAAVGADAATDATKDAAAADQLLGQRRQMEVDLLTAQGRSLEALALRRKYELETMDASLRPMAQAIYDAQDAAQAKAEADAAITKAAQSAAQVANTRRQMEIDLLTTQGRTLEATTLQRRYELEAMDASLRPLAEQIYAARDASTLAATAAQELAAAQKAQADAAARAAQITSTLADAMNSLRQGDLSPLLPGQKLAEARSTLDSTFAAALGRDETAAGKFPAVLQAFLAASRAQNASSTAYTSDFNLGQTMLSQLQGLFGAVPGHASGLAWVPKDNYLMRAHLGEAVAPAPVMEWLRSAGVPSTPGASAADVARLETAIREGNAMIGRLADAIRSGNAAITLAIDDSADKVGRTVARVAEASARA